MDETKKETLVDQIGVVWFWVCSTRFSLPLMEMTPEVSLRGMSLFATHTMGGSVIGYTKFQPNGDWNCQGLKTQAQRFFGLRVEVDRHHP